VHDGILKPQVPVTHNTEESQKEMPSIFIREVLENPLSFYSSCSHFDRWQHHIWFRTAEIGVHLRQAVMEFFFAEGEQLICVCECFLRRYGDATLYVYIVWWWVWQIKNAETEGANFVANHRGVIIKWHIPVVLWCINIFIDCNRSV